MTEPKLIFITGNAGTGKTTLLKHITGKGDTTVDESNEDFIDAVNSIREGNKLVVAPTGVAAINAGGTTINSFFKINPFKKYDTDNLSTNQVYQDFKLKRSKKDIIRDLDVLIIDEISMVKAEMLDLVDKLLRTFRGQYLKPFGGVQVVVIGDLFQLPPIKNKEANIKYKTEYFFSAKVFHELYFNGHVKFVELKKIYRQKSDEFITILNNIRDGSVTEANLINLNQRVGLPESDEGFITITTHNLNAENINATKYNSLQTEEKIYEAEVWGEFKDDFFKAIERVEVKIGAQVMVMKNNHQKGYYNGMIGTVKEINDNNVLIETKGLNVRIEKETWQKLDFEMSGGFIRETVVGEFTQMPLKLAWAITVHKSQGLTFDKVIAEVDASFDSGQVYVALSRCTSLEGLYLKSPIPKHAIKIDGDVVSFTNYIKARAV